MGDGSPESLGLTAVCLCLLNLRILNFLLLTTQLSPSNPDLFRYHNSQAVVISALQVAKHPFITPGPSTVFTPPPTRHSTLPGMAQGVLAGLSMSGSLPYGVTPLGGGGRGGDKLDGGGANGASVSSSGYPTPRPGSAASGFNNETVNSFYMGSPQVCSL